MNFRQIALNKILFLDIETVPAFESYEQMPDDWKRLWDKKASFINRDGVEDAEFYHQAGIYAEFGKIVAISVAFITQQRQLRVKSFYGEDESCILENFKQLVEKHFSGKDSYLCAHNGKEFDFPYIARRMLVNGISLPSVLDTHGRKPWETRFLDTMELWKFGDYKHFTSLELLAKLFELPSPKADISGEDVWKIYWQDKEVERIAEYCEKDTVSVAQIFLKFRGEEVIPQEGIVIAGREKC